MPELDSFDLRILELMQENSRRTGAELAEQVGLSAAACLRRVQRLRENGAIEKEVAVVAPKALGKKLKMIVLVTVEQDRPNRDRDITEKFRKLPEVTKCYHVTGAADWVMAVETADMEAYNDFVETHFNAPYIKRYESFGVLSTVK